MMNLSERLREVLQTAKAERDNAGRSERGRHLSLVVTKLEEALLWSSAEGLLS